MKKIVYIIIVIFPSFLCFCLSGIKALPNPWTDCADDISCASKKADFNFPLQVENYTVRAMKDMIEISFPLDKKRTVEIRKSVVNDNDADENGIKDISGDYSEYRINNTILIDGSVPFRVRGDKNKFYVASFAAESGYYSFYCKDGMKVKDINFLYKLVAQAEAPRYSEDNKNSYTIQQLMESRRVDGIVEPVYTQDCFPRTLEKKGVTKNCFERANLGDDTFCSESEINMIKEYYDKGQDKDPLNNGSKQFCAES